MLSNVLHVIIITDNSLAKRVIVLLMYTTYIPPVVNRYIVTKNNCSSRSPCPSTFLLSLRASYFSPNPTDKMYSVVAAAKALYEQLSVMGESSIDGDAFLDLWIYVIIKANVKDLVSGSSGGVVAVGEWGWTVLDGAATEPHRLRVCCEIALPMYDITSYFCDSNNIYACKCIYHIEKIKELLAYTPLHVQMSLT